MFDEVVFYTSLLICMSLGRYYKKLPHPDQKRNYGAGLGVLVACMICGHNMYHTLLMVWGNVIIIKCCDKRYVHQISMAYTWTYLLYMHFNLSCTVYVIWLHQTMALRLVGLAFEMNSIDNGPGRAHSSFSRLLLGDSDNPTVEPTAVDIIAYTYFFVGLHKGPYYRWKIFQEQCKSFFGALGDCRIITIQKLKKAIVCAVAYYIINLKFSSDAYQEDGFYYDHGSDYRFMYNVPELVKYFLYSQMMMMLCTSVFTETGFGVYPAKCEPLPGHGPTANYALLKIAAEQQSVALEQEYNFGMMKCFENKRVILGPKMKDSLKGWDMPTRYWFWSNIYRKFIKANKEVRSASSFFAWSVWYGPTVQQMIVSATVWVYIHLEAEYSSLYNTNGPMRVPWAIGFTMMRLFCLIYLTPCLVITDTSTVLRYYHSIFWMFHFLLVVLIIGAIVGYKTIHR